MSNSVPSTVTTNIVPVQGIFQPEPTFALVSLIGPAGTPFYANIDPVQSGLTITNSTIDSSVIGGTTPAAGTFTNIIGTTGQILTMPVVNSDIATKEYVDLIAGNIKVKASCLYATTGNITLSGLGTQAGGDWSSSLSAGDRILVKNQASSQFNGIYAAAAGAWTRTTDLDTWAETVGAYTFISAGTINLGTAWVCVAGGSGTINVTPMPWTQYSAVNSYSAGNGLQLTGTIFSVLPNGTTIDVSASGIKLSDTYAGQSSITTLGTISLGTWNGSTVAVQYGGTGATTLTGYVKGSGTSALTASSTIPNTDITGLGTMSTQNANAVAITDGSVAVTTLKTLGLTGYLYGNNTGAVTASTTIPNTAITGLGTMSTQNANAVAITGGTATGLTNLGADYVQFNTGATVTPAVGKIWWNGSSTLQIGMTANVTGKVNETQFIYAKASAAITKGDLLMHDGAVGASGVIKVKPATTSLADASQIIGVAAETLALNAFGLAQTTGYLIGLNTTGAAVGETWADGDQLYYNPAYTGGFTKVKPSAPNIKLPVAEVVNAGSGSSGSLLINIGSSSTLGGTDSNVQFGTLNNNDVIVYDSTLTYWKNVAQSTLAVGTATNLASGGAGQVPYQTGAGATSFTVTGTAGQVLTSNGSSAPTWSTPAAGITVSDDTTTNATRYPLFAATTTGTLTTEYVSSTKLQYNPSTGNLTTTTFTGSASGLTGVPAGQLTGTIPSGVLGNSTLYVGTTAIALNRASGSQSLTGVSIDGAAGSVTNSVTFNNGGAGDASGTAFNGAAARTVSYNTVGASPLAGSSSLTTVGTITSGTWNGSTVGVGYGGTGLTSTPTNGQIDIGNGTGFTRTTLTAGSNITITNGAGSITIAASTSGITAAKSIAFSLLFGG